MVYESRGACQLELRKGIGKLRLLKPYVRRMRRSRLEKEASRKRDDKDPD